MRIRPHPHRPAALAYAGLHSSRIIPHSVCHRLRFGHAAGIVEEDSTGREQPSSTSLQDLIKVALRARSKVGIGEFIDLSFSKYWYCGIDSQHSKYWNIYWVLIVLRLTKSGIEYVILAGSSFFPLSGAKSRFLPVLVVVLARAARDFLRIWAFGHLKSQNFRWPAGA